MLLEFFADIKDRHVVSRANRQKYLAEIAKTNWVVDAVPTIESEMRNFSSRGHGRLELMPSFGAKTVICLNLYTDNLFPKELGSEEFKFESPASLVYSLHPNGSVVVGAYPHSSAHASHEPPQYIIDIVSHVWSLAGLAGRSRIRRHLRTFAKFSYFTRSDALLTPSKGRFLQKLADRAYEFSPVFESAKDARRNRLAQEFNLGIGLVGGLIASTIFPLAKNFGDEAAIRMAETMDKCKKLVNPAYELKQCLSNYLYDLDKNISNFLSTGNIIFLALIIVLIFNLLLFRNQLKR